MSQIVQATDGLYFVSLLWNKESVDLAEVTSHLTERFGEEHITFEHPYFPMSSYYSKEMGEEENLCRQFLVFTSLSSRDNFVAHKLWAQDQEENAKTDGKRAINVDIGLLSLENLLLATGKSYSHRVHLRQGVYAEPTYRVISGEYQSFEWTYPDYQHDDIRRFFGWARELLLLKLNRLST